MIQERLAAIAWTAWWDNARSAYENLSDREQRLLSFTALLLGATLVLLPLYWVWSAMAETHTQNEEIRNLLNTLQANRDELRQLRATRQAAERRYNNPTPPLGSFVEEKAAAQGITLREVNDEPQKAMAAYTRREVSISIPEVGLAPLMRLLADIDNSPHAVGITKANIEHFQAGDKYSAKLSITAYDRSQKAAASSTGSDGSP